MKRQPSFPERALGAQRMTPLAGGGRSRQVSPTPRPAMGLEPGDSEKTLFSSVGFVEEAESGIYRVQRNRRSIRLVGDLTAALDGDTDIDVIVNGSVIDTLTIPDGDLSEEMYLTHTFAAGAKLRLEVTSVGDGEAFLTVHVELA